MWIVCPTCWDVLGTLRDTTRLQQRGLICVYWIFVVLRVDNPLVTPTILSHGFFFCFFLLHTSGRHLLFPFKSMAGLGEAYASNSIHTLHAHHGLLKFGILFQCCCHNSSQFPPSGRNFGADNTTPVSPPKTGFGRPSRLRPAGCQCKTPCIH